MVNSKKYYCHLLSPTTIDATNLQLYSLEQAANNWNNLVESIEREGLDNIIHLKEMFMFILNCLGLSLAQLLGQNSPFTNKEEIDDPRKLLSSILIEYGIDRDVRRRINNNFEKFSNYYDSVRHFGKNSNDQRYQLIDELTLAELDRFRQMAIEIWNIFIMKFKRDGHDLDQITSVTDIVWFRDVPIQCRSEILE